MTKIISLSHQLLITFSLILLSSCHSSKDSSENQLTEISGQTMGTTYHVKFINPPHFATPEEIKKGVDSLLEEVNNQMSHYKSDSEITRFNNYKGDDWFKVSRNFAYVVLKSLEVAEKTKGAYDPTVGTLVDLWGFGPKKVEKGKLPSDKEIKKLLKKIGYQKLQARMDPPSLKKESPHIRLDLSGSAKGFGVDAVALYLQTRQVHHYMVEIGGEIRVKGVKPNKEQWKIAIESPSPKTNSPIQKILQLTDTSLATSGDYRNYFEKEGKRYSHTINPKTGYPIEHRLASVTVLHPECALADAYATGVSVMGPNEGKKLLTDLNIPSFLIIKSPESEGEGFTTYKTKSFKSFELD